MINRNEETIEFITDKNEKAGGFLLRLTYTDVVG